MFIPGNRHPSVSLQVVPGCIRIETKPGTSTSSGTRPSNSFAHSRFENFGDSSIDLSVVLYTTVETHYTFPARAKEAIYNAFHENGIEIPFPQRDVYIKPLPEKK